VAKFADLLRHSQTLLADGVSGNSGSKRPASVQEAASDSASDDGGECGSDGASQAGSSGDDTYSGSDGDGSDDEDGGDWGAQAQPAKAGREARKRLQQQQQQQQQKQSHALKQQKLGRVAGATSAFVSSLRGEKGRGSEDDAVEHIDVGGGSDRKNRMGQRQVRRSSPSLPCALRALVA
jgi:hypothetical protein